MEPTYLTLSDEACVKCSQILKPMVEIKCISLKIKIVQYFDEAMSKIKIGGHIITRKKLWVAVLPRSAPAQHCARTLSQFEYLVITGTTVRPLWVSANISNWDLLFLVLCSLNLDHWVHFHYPNWSTFVYYSYWWLDTPKSNTFLICFSNTTRTTLHYFCRTRWTKGKVNRWHKNKLNINRSINFR